ncbi:MAG: PrsW family glutamic-type intramembrane protease [Candidatus Marinimicrobia bacterium]|nr:PrsW family glutamic-type intramembrane protease [Candidatus Neomarinimicrobiota bacterium]
MLLKHVLEILLLSVVPGILWIAIVYRTDFYEPEPKRLIIKAFVIGGLTVFPAALLEKFFNVGSNTLMALLTAPVTEESLKFLFFMIFFYHHRDFDEPLDGIIYACSIAIGFATVENIFYVFSAFEYERVYEIASLRAFLSIPGHFLFSSLWGYAAGVVKFRLRSGATLGAGLLAAILLHSGFNFTAIVSAWGSSLFIVIFSVYAWILFSRRLRELQNESRNRNHDDSL